MLVILDRNVDLFPMVSHSWTYQALVNDVLGMKLNRVSVEVSLFLLVRRPSDRCSDTSSLGTRRR